MNSDRDPGPVADVVNSSLPQPRSHRRSRTESISVSTEPAISTNSRSRPKLSGHSGSTSLKMDSPPCYVCGRKFRSPKALYGHYRCHPERKWRGTNPPPYIAEENQKVVDSVDESGGENEKDKKSEEVIVAAEKGEDCKTCESIISSTDHGLGNSATVGETDRIEKGRLWIDLNKLPSEEDDTDSSDSCCTLIFGIRLFSPRKADH